jgi:hypothetical protein
MVPFGGWLPTTGKWTDRAVDLYKVTDDLAPAAGNGERLLWTSWQNYPKVADGERVYARIGDRLYTHHAVDRLQPSGLGPPAGTTGAGRSISPNFVEDVLQSAKGEPVKGPNGEDRLSFISGTMQAMRRRSLNRTAHRADRPSQRGPEDWRVDLLESLRHSCLARPNPALASASLDPALRHGRSIPQAEVLGDHRQLPTSSRHLWPDPTSSADGQLHIDDSLGIRAQSPASPTTRHRWN